MPIRNLTGMIPYFTKSKTVTRLPTGDKRQVPSGLKSRSPRLYTVPRRFENYDEIQRVRVGNHLSKPTLNSVFIVTTALPLFMELLRRDIQS